MNQGTLRVQPGVQTAIDSLLVPLEDQLLLIPMTAIAEVIACEGQQQETGEHSPWLYGYISWRNLTVPLISFEGVTGGERPELQLISKVAIVNAVGAAREIGFYAIRLRDYPRPVHVEESDLLELPAADGSQAGVLMTATVEEQAAKVPDLELLEQYCSRLLQQ